MEDSSPDALTGPIKIAKAQMRNASSIKVGFSELATEIMRESFLVSQP